MTGRHKQLIIRRVHVKPQEGGSVTVRLLDKIPGITHSLIFGAGTHPARLATGTCFEMDEHFANPKFGGGGI